MAFMTTKLPVREMLKHLNESHRKSYRKDFECHRDLREKNYPIVELPRSQDQTDYQQFLTVSSMVAWCQANCGDENFATINAHTWAFSRDEDAVAFKLAWIK